MLAMVGTEIDRGRGLPILPAPQLGRHFGERAIAMVPEHQANGTDGLSATAVQLEATIQPIGEAVLTAVSFEHVSALELRS